MNVSEHYFGPTEKRWWEPQVLLANFVMLGIPILVAVGCGFVTELQRRELDAKQAAAVAACNHEADKVTAEQTIERGEAYLTCMDHRPITQPAVERVTTSQTAAG